MVTKRNPSQMSHSLLKHTYHPSGFWNTEDLKGVFPFVICKRKKGHFQRFSSYILLESTTVLCFSVRPKVSEAFLGAAIGKNASLCNHGHWLLQGVLEFSTNLSMFSDHPERREQQLELGLCTLLQLWHTCSGHRELWKEWICSREPFSSSLSFC